MCVCFEYAIRQDCVQRYLYEGQHSDLSSEGHVKKLAEEMTSREGIAHSPVGPMESMRVARLLRAATLSRVISVFSMMTEVVLLISGAAVPGIVLVTILVRLAVT